MERLFYIAIGFVVAVVLLVVFLVAKDVVENKKSLLEQKILSIARKECQDAKANIYWYNIMGFEQHVNKLIDRKLAEKEGEHETAELQRAKNPTPGGARQNPSYCTRRKV